MRIGRSPLTESSVVLFLQSGRAVRADAEIHLTLAEHLPELGFTVLAATPDGDPSPSEIAIRMSAAGATVLPTHFGPTSISRRAPSLARLVVVEPWRTIASTLKLVRFARRHRVAVVHCVEKTREALFGYVVARATGARLVIHLHLKVAPWFSLPTRWVMRRADGLLAISQFVAGSAEEMGYDPERIAVVMNGMVHSSSNMSRASARALLLAELGLDDDALLVGIAARLTPWKGHDELIDALGTLAPDNPQVVLIAMGDEAVVGGPHDAHPLLDAADRSGLGRQRVHLLGFRTDLPTILAGLDVFAMPSFEEPFGLVFIEAMAAATPVVALDNGGTPEVVVDGSTGLLAAPGDRADLVHQLRRMFDDPALRASLGAAGAARVSAAFTGERMAREVAKFYRSLTS